MSGGSPPCAAILRCPKGAPPRGMSRDAPQEGNTIMSNSSAKAAKATVSGRAKLRPLHPSEVVSPTVDTDTTTVETRVMPSWLDPTLVRPLRPIAFYEAHLDLTDSDPELDGDVDDSYLAVLISRRDAAAHRTARVATMVAAEHTHRSPNVKTVDDLLRRGIRCEQRGLSRDEQALDAVDALLRRVPAMGAQPLENTDDRDSRSSALVDLLTSISRRYETLITRAHAQGSWRDAIIPERLQDSDHVVLDLAGAAQWDGFELINRGTTMQTQALDRRTKALSRVIAKAAKAAA